MNDALIVTLLSALPKRQLSQLQGAAARTGVSKHLNRWFAERYGIDLDEMVGAPEDYPTLQDFFVRELKPGRRPIDPAPEAIVSPADSRATFFGPVGEDGTVQASAEVRFHVDELTGEPGRYHGGSYAVLYLSPKDYHRVHHPVDGVIAESRYLPGQFWPVFDAAVREVEGLLARQERLVAAVDTPAHGRMSVALIAAYGVGRMSAAYSDVITNAESKGGTEVFNPPIPCARGAELGRFNLGSTVILVAERGRAQWELTTDQRVKVGQRIGRFL